MRPAALEEVGLVLVLAVLGLLVLCLWAGFRCLACARAIPAPRQRPLASPGPCRAAGRATAHFWCGGASLTTSRSV